MPDEPNPRRPKREQYRPKAETLALLKVSGNPINGLGRNDATQAVAFLLASARSASLWRIADCRAAEFAQMSRFGAGVYGRL